MLNAAVSSPYSQLVDRIQSSHPSASEELYEVFSRGLRGYLSRHLPPDVVEQKVPDILLTVERAIQRGELRSPEELPRLVHSVAKRHAEGWRVPRSAAKEDRDAKTMVEFLEGLPGREREALIRFYLREQTERQICADTHIPVARLELLKAKARAHFAAQSR